MKLVVVLLIVGLLSVSYYLPSQTPITRLDHVKNVNFASVIPGCTGSPCATGLVDYGMTYAYFSPEFKSWTNFTSLNIGLSDFSQYNHELSIQQNLVAYLYEGNSEYEFWSQFAMEITQSSTDHFLISPLDNVWNFSSLTSSMNPSEYTGDLFNSCSSVQSNPVYICGSNLSVHVKLPFEIQMISVTALCNGGNGIAYVYLVYQSNRLITSSNFDAICFPSNVQAQGRFVVGGNNPAGLYNDAENVVAGAGGGAYVTISKLQMKMSFDYENSAYQFVPIAHAWSESGDTGESVKAVHETARNYVATGTKSSLDTQTELW